MSDRYGLTTITTELHDDGVLVATLNRPEHRNSLDPVMHLELKQLYEQIVDDEELNAVVLTGRGQVLLRGRRLQQHGGQRQAYPDGHPGLLIESVGMARNILAVRVPMISAINGDAIGIGATISLFCDIVLHGRHTPGSPIRTCAPRWSRATAVPCSGRCSWVPTGPRST